jgi:hypothetical protein
MVIVGIAPVAGRPLFFCLTKLLDAAIISVLQEKQAERKFAPSARP